MDSVGSPFAPGLVFAPDSALGLGAVLIPALMLSHQAKIEALEKRDSRGEVRAAARRASLQGEPGERQRRCSIPVAHNVDLHNPLIDVAGDADADASVRLAQKVERVSSFHSDTSA